LGFGLGFGFGFGFGFGWNVVRVSVAACLRNRKATTYLLLLTSYHLT
jgi:hypothetical protein